MNKNKMLTVAASGKAEANNVTYWKKKKEKELQMKNLLHQHDHQQDTMKSRDKKFWILSSTYALKITRCRP